MKKGFILTVLLLSLAISVFGCAAGLSADASEKDVADLARGFVETSPTYGFDGMSDTLKIVGSQQNGEAWAITFEFQSTHGGYGDRTGQMVTQAITPHTVKVTVEAGQVTAAVIDGVWDEMAQQTIV
ncbi:MAG: hypothetical protein ACRKGH_03425 [Dehalogenimonas sp.]